ncbi:hypothetical protein EW026_g7803 [Hermanssonia centrifuga]|uniref:Isochorismatase-like domain-containing protein n=1 Tax=Hermanssonia centrifuga TaxID=98765 RepID=A0A4S4KAX7_9APHY|nr:hypothetical protein EW026_g7803 [Hermanssonia centrifuga]
METDSPADVRIFSKPGLVLIDNQIGFTHPTHWGVHRSNPSYEENLGHLLSAFRDRGHPIFHVAHHSTDPNSPLNPISNPLGAHFLSFAEPHEGEPVFIKTVNSSFIGTTLEKAIREADIKELFVAGLTTDHCVSTTTRMGANLGVVGETGEIYVVGDAVANFERGKWDAETVHQVNLASLDGEFAAIISTEGVIRSLQNWCVPYISTSFIEFSSYHDITDDITDATNISTYP